MNETSSRKYRNAQEVLETYIPGYTPPARPARDLEEAELPLDESTTELVDALLLPLKEKLEQLRLS
jgi:hypothetical protein